MGPGRAVLVAAPRRGRASDPRTRGPALRPHAGGPAPRGRHRMAGPELSFVVGLRAGLLPPDAGRARVPGHSRPSRRPSRAPRGTAHPARPGPDGAPRPPADEPGQPGWAHGE